LYLGSLAIDFEIPNPLNFDPHEPKTVDDFVAHLERKLAEDQKISVANRRAIELLRDEVDYISLALKQTRDT